MYVHYMGWRKQGSADEVCIIVDIPNNMSLNPDYLVDRKVLMMYGRRTGKLRAKIVPWIDYCGHIRFNKKAKGDYLICKPNLNQVKFKHLIPQVEKHLSWALLTV